MAFTYDLTTAAGKVRLLIPDNQGTAYVYEDAEIAAFLGMNGDDYRMAAADAIEGIARSSVLRLKYVTVNKISTNGPSVGAELRAAAAELRRQAAADIVPVILSQAVDEFTAHDLYLRGLVL